jgi:hypothetical protein|nr:MAG TPA_asm: DNA (cytosine-5)-methyltransferase 3A [Caudoviricetes sp.]
MKVLVACEESQEVCKAFRERGHEAYSCDVQGPSGGHPEWHILGDALEALKGEFILTMDNLLHYIGRWDMVIAHPPCTYLTAASAVRLFAPDHSIKDSARDSKGWAAADFFMEFWKCDIRYVAIENPCPLRRYSLPPYSQIIEPYMFGDPWKKRTCLWLRNLPLLRPTNIVEPKGLWVGSTSGRRDASVYSRYSLSSHRDQRTRSRTFPGIAAAMAEQWGSL